MQARYVPQIEVASLEPDAALWSKAGAESVALLGTPVGLQPTAMIRTKFMNVKIGTVEEVSVRAVHDGRTLSFRLEWSDAEQNTDMTDPTTFSDGAAVLLPGKEGAPLMTMGVPTLPVNAWYWRADEDGGGRQVVAEGVGTTRPAGHEQVLGHGVWREGRWQVVISRQLKVENPEPVVQLEAGQKTGFGVAVWEGGAGERAGIKAFSGDWRELVLEGMPTARK